MADSILIRGGTLIDGTGAPGRPADVLVKWGRIVDVGQLDVSADVIIDAAGQVVCPGFIDSHTHSDLVLLADPQHEMGLRQGITTEILGQDGLSYAPLSPENLDEYRRYLAGLNANPATDHRWSTVAEYRRQFDGTVAVNTAYLVPHGALRLETVGFRDAPLQGTSLAQAQQMLARAFDEGAVGFSTGLSYYPCAFSDTEELVELCRVAAVYGRPFVIHLRTVFAGEPFDPVEEAIAISERSGAPLHFSHFRTSETNFGQVDKLMRPIDAAIERGVDISLECYPYPAGAGFAMIMMPRWANVGGYEGLMVGLSDPEERKRIIEDVRRQFSIDGIITQLADDTSELIGRSFSELARERGVDIAELVCDLMWENKLKVGFKQSPPERHIWEQIERDVMELMKRPNYMVGSDSVPGRHPHPRTYGCFPRFLRFQREFQFMPLEALINRMTQVPAQRFGLSDRGVIARGKAADIVVFDPAVISDRATYEDPNQYAVGISHVLVNGRIALAGGEATGVLAGRALPEWIAQK